MTTSNLANKFRYEGNGSTDTFAFTGRVFSTSDLVVEIILRADDSPVETLDLGSDYTVTVNSSESASIVVDAGKIPSATQDILIYRSIAKTQTLDLPTGTRFPAVSVENALDRLTAIAQDQSEVLDRTAKLPIQSSLSAISIPAPSASKVIAWNAGGTALENGPTTTDIENASANAAAAAASASAAATSESNAGTSESNAAASASAAAQSASEGLYADVISKVFADSPIAPLLTEEGTIFRIDTSGGNVVVNLDELGDYGEDMKFAFVKVTGDANTITINRDGSDTIEGNASVVIEQQYEVHVLIGDSATGTWLDVIHTSGIADGTVTLAKLASGALEEIRSIPQNSKSAAYTLVAADAGKHIFHPSADTTTRTWTIPANASVAFDVGTAVTFINQDSAGDITIAITSDTMRLAGAGTTGSRTLAANGIATAIKVTSTEWIISGTGLS